MVDVILQPVADATTLLIAVPSGFTQASHSHFFLSACFHLLPHHLYWVQVYLIFWLRFWGSSGRKHVIFCFSASGSKVHCWSTSSAYTTLVILQLLSCIYALELFKSRAPGWKQRQGVVWVFSQIKVMCLLLQLHPRHFLMDYLAQGCSAGFAFVWHLLRKTCWVPESIGVCSPLMLAFENAGLTLAQQLWESAPNANFNQCYFLIKSVPPAP